MFASVIHICTHRLFFTPGGCSVYVVHCTHTASTAPISHSQEPICSVFLVYTALTQPPPSPPVIPKNRRVHCSLSIHPSLSPHCPHRSFPGPDVYTVPCLYTPHSAPTVPTGHSQEPTCTLLLAYTALTQPPPSHRYPETTDVYILFVYYSHKGLSVCICIQNPLMCCRVQLPTICRIHQYIFSKHLPLICSFATWYPPLHSIGCFFHVMLISAPIGFFCTLCVRCFLNVLL